MGLMMDLVSLAKEYGLEAKRYERLSLDDLKNFLDHDRVVIISIKWAFKGSKNFEGKNYVLEKNRRSSCASCWL